MDFGAVSWLGVVLAAFAFFLLGGLWYGPLFGRPWKQLVGVSPLATGQPSLKMLGLSYFAGLVGIIAMAALFGAPLSVGEGASWGLLTGVLLAAPTLGLQYVFERRPFTFLLINGGYNIVGLALAGAILGALQ